MILWPAGLAAVIVWQVFRDPAFDYRLVMAGALLPDAVDAATGGAWVSHTLVASVTLLAVVMAATRGRRRARRRLLALPVGTFLHLVLDGVWARPHLFWWPWLGGSLGGPLPALDHGAGVLIAEELAGAAALVWFARRFRITDPGAWGSFWRTGRLVGARRSAGG